MNVPGAKELELPTGYIKDVKEGSQHSLGLHEQRWHADLYKLSQLGSGMELVERALHTVTLMDSWFGQLKQTHASLLFLPHAVAYEVYYLEKKHTIQWDMDWAEHLEGNKHLKTTRLKHTWKTWQAIVRGGGLGYYPLFERGINFNTVCDWLKNFTLPYDRIFIKGWSAGHVIASVMATLFEQISPRKKSFKSSTSAKKLKELLNQRVQEVSEVH
jgi:hypothetical protein